MTRRRKWAVIPGLALIAVTATVLSAYGGAQAGAAAQPTTPPAAPAAPAAAPAGQAGQAAPGAAQPGAPGTAAALVQPPIDTAAARAALELDPEEGPWAYSGASSDQGYAPEQPINFPHPQHVQLLGMNCLYCHYSANKASDPGLPATNTCMGCHQVVARNQPEIQKLAKYWADSTPIPWVRIHKVPDYVQFPHMRHVNAGVTCQTCHGEVQKMPRVYQYASLNMGWCINCHVERKARYDCSTCHY